jgi:hypothetical protein
MQSDPQASMSAAALRYLTALIAIKLANFKLVQIGVPKSMPYAYVFDPYALCIYGVINIDDHRGRDPFITIIYAAVLVPFQSNHSRVS